jgi:hypothetical protein
MTRLLLNCETPVSALHSLAGILTTTPETLLEELRAVEIGYDDLTGDVEQKLEDQLLASRTPPRFSVRWFHGTRLHQNHTLMTDGLLPAHMMKERLRDCLQSLCRGLERRGCSPFGTSKSFKPQNEGPFGMLCRTAVVSPAGDNGHYICRPELVDDIAGELLGENYRALTERFSIESTPCVIHFAGVPNATTLARALRYVHETLIEGLADIDSAASACEYFDGGGLPVPPDRILQIEPFPSNVARDA